MSNLLGKKTHRRTFTRGAAASAAIIGAPSAIFSVPAVLAQDAVTLEVWGGVPGENGPQDLVDAFQEANPDIKVNYTRYVNDDTGNTQLDTALQGGTPIDVFFTYSAPRLGQRIKAGAAADLTPYVEADADVKKWATETSGIFTYEDKFFSIPTTSEAMFVFANKNVLDDAGVTLPESWTVDEFREMAKSLTKDGAFGTYSPPDVARMSLGPDYWYKDGGKASNFDAPEFRASVQLHRDMIDDGSAFPWTDVLAQDLKAYAQTPFLTEQTILWLNSPYSLRFVNDKEQYPHEFVTTFAPAPVPADVKDPWNGGSINNWLQMNAKTKVADAAWKFIRFWLVDGGQYMLKAGKVPAYAMADQQSVVDGLLGESKDELYDVEAFKKVVFAEGTRLVTDTITTASAEISQIISGLDDRCFIGEISVDDWVNEAKSQSDDAIKNAG